MGEIRKTLREFVPPLVKNWHGVTVFILAEVYAVVAYIAESWAWSRRWAMNGPPLWLVIGIAVAGFIYAQFVVLHSLRKQRDRLQKATDYEGGILALSRLLDEGTAKLNVTVESEAEYAAWQDRFGRWREAVENTIGEYFGQAERLLFHNAILIPNHQLGGFNAEHQNDKALFAHKLEMLRDIILRLGERAANWRHEAQ